MSKPVIVRFIGDAKHLSRTTTQVEGRVGAFSTRVRGLIGPAIAGAAIVGAAAVFKIGKDAVAAGRESIAIAKQTDAVIKSTGGVANVSAKHAANLAASLSKVSAVDDDVIQGGENILLTFTNIKNTKTDKIFDQTSKAALNMAASLNHGEVNASNLQAANMQLGKALQDPLKGITKLGKQGIIFSEQQKEQVANFVKHGQTAKAQGVILAEVTRQFAGSAAAAKTPWKSLMVTLGNIQESIGKALIPALDKGAKWINEKLIPAVASFWHTHGPQFKAILGAISILITGVVVPAVKVFIGWVSTTVNRIRDFFKGTSKSAGETKNTFHTVFATIKSVLSSIQSIIRTVLGWIQSFWKAHGETLIRAAKTAMSSIMQVIRGVFQIIQGIFKVFSSLLKGDWRGMWEGVKSILRGALNIVVGVIRLLWNTIKTVFSVGISLVVSLVKALGGKLWTAARGAMGTMLSALSDKWQDVKAWASKLPGSFVSAMGDLGKALVHKFSGAIKAVLGFLGIKSPSKVFERIGHALIDGLAKGISKKMKAIPNLLGKLRDMAFGVAGDIGRGFTNQSFSGAAGGTIQALAKNMAAQMGWTGSQWNALYQLVQHESGWNPNAQNPTSTAYGLFQFLNSTWSAMGFRKTSDVQTQIAAGLNYIKRSYGSPSAAWSAWLSRSPHWYGEGGLIKEPVFGVGSRSGESYVFGESGTERVTPVGRGSSPAVLVQVQSNADPYRIGREVAWAMRTSGR